jgi:hypothetical protein
LAEGQAAAEELFNQLKVSDFLQGTLATLVQLGYAKLEGGQTEQTRVAIEALRALLPVLEETAPAEAARDLRQATANLQLAFASKVNETSDQPADETEGET